MEYGQSGFNSQARVVAIHPRLNGDLSRIYVLDPFDATYLEIPYRTLSRPAITLWEHRAAIKRVREAHSGQVDEDMIFTAHEEMQEIERNAMRLSKSARRRQARPKIGQAPIQINEGSAWQGDIQEPDAVAPPRPFFDIEEW